MVVQKFGGTSVADADAILRLVDIVGRTHARDGRGPAVVVSAMSGATDMLLGLANKAAAGRTSEALAAVAELRVRHDVATRILAPHDDALRAMLGEECDRLAAVVQALSVIRDVSPRTLDVVAATGELLSSRIVAAALNHAGIASDWVDARGAVITNDDHGRAIPRMPETMAAIRATAGVSLERGRIPVLGGFVGATPDGHTTTLGRGGSDYSGALVGAGIEASEIQIWTDVDGMLTADPTYRREAAPGAAAVVCRGRRARVLRCEGAASQHHPAGSGAGHPGAHSEFAPTRRFRDEHHRPRSRRMPGR